MTLAPLEEHPLVTFALFAYNQEKYIREAVEGAFAQTYEPLEIILSDDCSTDRTFEIMKCMAETYCGNHRIVLNRNAANLGISSHVRFIHEMSCGSIVVHAAGDDISRPDRTERIVEAFIRSEQRPSLVTSNITHINNQGEKLVPSGESIGMTIFEQHRNPLKITTPTNGCAVGIDRQLITSFPAPISGIIAEDSVLERRAILLGGKLFIPYELVDYRVTGNSASSFRTRSRLAYLDRLLKWQADDETRLSQLINDIEHIGASPQRYRSDLNAYRRRLEINRTMMHGPLFSSLLAFFQIALSCGSVLGAKTALFNFLLRWCPFVLRYNE